MSNARNPKEKPLTVEQRLQQTADELQERMLKLARELKFEEAAKVRDEMQEMQQHLQLLPGRSSQD